MGKTWTQREYHFLEKAYAEGLAISSIARKLERSPSSINKALSRFNIRKIYARQKSILRGSLGKISYSSLHLYPLATLPYSDHNEFCFFQKNKYKFHLMKSVSSYILNPFPKPAQDIHLESLIDSLYSPLSNRIDKLFTFFPFEEISSNNIVHSIRPRLNSDIEVDFPTVLSWLEKEAGILATLAQGSKTLYRFKNLPKDVHTPCSHASKGQVALLVNQLRKKRGLIPFEIHGINE
jgi:hypothetical protein